MTLDQLRIFVAVAEREHMTRAAEALCLTQSAVSHAIMTLEQIFGLVFFDRIGRRIRLTQAGGLFLEEARAVLKRAGAAQQRMRALTTLDEGSLHLWASQTIASYWLPARINRFHEQHPAITLEVTISNTEDICQHLLDDTLAMGLIEGAVTDPTLTATSVATDQLLLVVTPEHEWARHPPCPQDLAGSDWILREKGSGTRASFEKAVADWGVDRAALPIVMELTSNEAIANAVATGNAATVLSASVVAGLIENGLLHHVGISFPERCFSLVRNARALSPVEKAFIALL
ncbi:LysR family transcriptional regulator [Asaia bogorensis]|uniref:LysR family transcriptional regulator n=1 Tax=Asaia bogorensis NBRC 16594 TaxID=1231624 RepID=A0AAN4R677_9PROT|nr:LysR family transcriptional regulator [Asaia bogorensis]BAT19138.1 transcriptional regulator LysR [Asaia bogorensis NBRC 16594]GBQ73061.1 LysR family transcriptional regulator [Asaia bogorensis NBRC 16594]GEL53494.1 LysR family transcriptional regulator [Asaia bogorensis NBRC 16594]